jgi:hypothetical protein
MCNGLESDYFETGAPTDAIAPFTSLPLSLFDQWSLISSLTHLTSSTVIGQSLESWVTSKFKPLAYAYILLRPEGYP